MEVLEDELQDLYVWVDEIPLSRPKRNIARDFSDGVLVAEVSHYFFPRDVQLHNYSLAQKMYNWNTLNTKVFHKLGFSVPKKHCEAAARAQPMAIEQILKFLRYKFSELTQLEQGAQNTAPLPPSSKSGHVPQSSTVQYGVLTCCEHNQPHGNGDSSKECQTISELREMNELLETKTKKLEQLVRLKDAKIQALKAQLADLMQPMSQ